MTDSIDTLAQSTNGWDRTFFDLSSKMMEPFCYVSELYTRCTSPLKGGEFDFCSTKTKETAFRALAAVGAFAFLALVYTFPLATIIGTVAWGLTGKLLRVIAYSLQKNGFTHVKGNALEKTFQEGEAPKVISYNVLGPSGGYHYTNGGTPHFRSRVDDIVKKLKTSNADVICLQEIYDTAFAEMLIERLKDDYSHFYFQTGAKTTWGSCGGIMTISKCGHYDFKSEEFSNNGWKLKRTFDTLEVKKSPSDNTPFFRIIGTHLIHGPSAESKNSTDEDRRKAAELRVSQIDQISTSLSQRGHSLPTVIAADSNVERDSQEGQILRNFLTHTYEGNQPTCSERLVNMFKSDLKNEERDEIIDIISLIKSRTLDGQVIPNVRDANVEFDPAQLILSYDPNNPDTTKALSDHHAICTQFRLRAR